MNEVDKTIERMKRQAEIDAKKCNIIPEMPYFSVEQGWSVYPAILKPKTDTVIYNELANNFINN